MPQSGDDQCAAGVGHALSAEYWGHGIATRAVKMAINEGLKEFSNVIRLQAMKHGYFKTLGISMSDTLETLLHACPHCIRRKKIFTYLKSFFLL